MNRLRICLGSNVSEAVEQIDHALAFILANGTLCADSQSFSAADDADPAAAPYINRLVEIDTPLSAAQLLALTKPYEAACREKYPHAIAIDIDIIEQNGSIIRPWDAVSPHYNRGLGLLKSIS